MKIENRAFLINWLNSLEIPITRIEEIGKGVALCMLLKKIDAAFPVYKSNPLTEGDYFHNLKLVQIYLERKQVKIPLPIEKMIKLKMQDNLQAIQFLYRHVVRELSLPNRSPQQMDECQLPVIALLDSEATQKSMLVQKDSKITTCISEQVQQLKEQNNKLKCLTDKLKDCSEIIQKERNFYFEKLVQIEQFLLENNGEKVDKEKILRILYKA